MTRLLKLHVLIGLTVCMSLPAVVARGQIVQTLASWQFEPGEFLSDSSGNANTLVNGVGANAATESPDVMDPEVSTQSAFFDGNAVMRTAATFDLTAASINHLRITWRQRNQTLEADGQRMVFTQASDYTAVAGGFATAVNSAIDGTSDPATQGFVALSGTGQLSALYTQSTGANPGTWRWYRADIDLTAATPDTAIVVRDLETGLVVSTANNMAGVLPVAFANDTFYIGATGDDGANGFFGNIDSLVVQSVLDIIPPLVPQINPQVTPTVTPVTPITPVVSPGAGGANGVIIDAKGVLRLRSTQDPSQQRLKQRIAAARANPNTRVDKPSKLRKVSLNRLETALHRRLEKGQSMTEEMAVLAGLTQARYVFFYPDSGDVVLAGPAEGWTTDNDGRPRGIMSARPTLQLQDLIVALRAFAPSVRKPPVILCSIDPTEEGLARMQEFLNNVGTRITPGDTEMIVNGLRTNLGMQNVRIAGISPNTHFAQVLLECDYRMKLIGIGIERPPVRMASYVDRASPGGSRKALERWFFIPDYQCARVAADGLALELSGDGVKLVSENQLVAADGSRTVSGKGNRASELFTTAFTQKYDELATHLPIFADLRNVIDLSIAAAFIHQQDFYAKAGWEAALLGSEQVLPVEVYRTPLQVETVCTAVWKGRRLMTPVGGGVTIRAHQALRSTNLLPDEDGKLSGVRESIDLKDLPADRWWWD